jgi:uncharacterized protein YndB with AHSA1/START domain
MNETVITEYLDQKQMIVEREFAGPLDLVWRAWTEPELLDKWWAPKPWKAVTKHMDFRVGGYWLYCMQGPEGEKHWGRANYLKIKVEDFFDAEDAFCDEDGNVNNELPGTDWHVTFTATESGTTVEVTTTFASKDAMRQLIEMGVKEGTAMAHKNLDELLESMVAASGD